MTSEDLSDKAEKAADKVDAALEPDGSGENQGLSQNSGASEPRSSDGRPAEVSASDEPGGGVG